MTTLVASWTSGGEPIQVITEIQPADNFEAKLAGHVTAVREARAAHPPD